MHAPVGSRLDGGRLRKKHCDRSTRRRKMQGRMSEGDPTAKADTRECDQEAAAEAKKPTELGSSPTAAAEAKKPTKLGGSPTAAAPPVAQKPQTGGNGGWGAAAHKRAVDKQQKAYVEGWTAYAEESTRQTPEKRARQVFLDRIEDAENRKYAAECDFKEACGDWDVADHERDAASADRQAASSHQDSANRDKQRSVVDIHSAKEQLRNYDEEMMRLDKEEEDE